MLPFRIVNLRINKSRFGLSLLIITLFFKYNYLSAQNCDQSLPFKFEAKSTGSFVNWAQFPEFSLPFKVVYSGIDFLAPKDIMLKRGFTHFSNPNNLPSVPTKNRAFIYYAPAGPERNQPWSVSKSPYGNDMPAYERYWDTQIDRMKSETGNPNFIDADILMFDIEKQIRSDDSILLVKKLPSTPIEARNLSDSDFIIDYKKKLQELYFRCMDYTIKNGKPNSKFISSYSDSPILNTFINIQGKTWDKWKTDVNAINYITYDFEKNKVGGKAYDIQNMMAPSAYFYYDYPHPFAGEYLSYLLFQCEANRAWTAKELMLFVWVRYSYNVDFIHKKIKPWMAEACGIFPFFAGAKGIWLWDQLSLHTFDEDLSNYDYFTKGLYRVSQFKEMWEGDYKLIETISARDYNENKLPIWRGVLKGDKILIVAQNSFAKSSTEKVKINVAFGSFSKTIELTGYEIFMCKFDYNLATGIEDIVQISDYKLYPNPTNGNVQIELKLKEPSSLKIEVRDLKGALLFEKYEGTKKENFIIDFELTGQKEVVVSVFTEKERQSKKLIIN